VTLLQVRQQAHRDSDWQSLIDAIPYARFLGMEAASDEHGFLCQLLFHHDLVGNQQLPALHGGLVAGFLEATALFHLLVAVADGPTPRPVDFTIDYLRSAGPKTSYARCHIVKQGRRICNVRVVAWQDSEAKPYAVARGNVLLDSETEEQERSASSRRP